MFYCYSDPEGVSTRSCQTTMHPFKCLKTVARTPHSRLDLILAEPTATDADSARNDVDVAKCRNHPVPRPVSARLNPLWTSSNVLSSICINSEIMSHRSSIRKALRSIISLPSARTALVRPISTVWSSSATLPESSSSHAFPMSNAYRRLHTSSINNAGPSAQPASSTEEPST